MTVCHKNLLRALLEDDDQLKCLKQNLSYRKYVAKKIDIVSRKGGKFASRVARLGGEIQKCFVQWNNLSDDQKRNLYLNTRYIIDTIAVYKQMDAIKLARLVPYMQHQGGSHYCSVNAFNNVVGKEVTTACEMNDVADDLWLKNFEHLELSVTDDAPRHRDSNGFHSIDVMATVATKHGYCILIPDECIQIRRGKLVPKIPQQLVSELLRCYKSPVKLLIHNKKNEHYTAMEVYHDRVWYFISLKRQPSMITAAQLMAVLADKNTSTFIVTNHEQLQSTDEIPMSDLSSSITVR